MVKRIIRVLIVGLLIVPLVGFAGLFTEAQGIPTTDIDGNKIDYTDFSLSPDFYDQNITYLAYSIYNSKHPYYKIRLHNNRGGSVYHITELWSAIRKTNSTVVMEVKGLIVSAAFDTAFLGKPSRIYYGAYLRQHSVSGAGIADESYTRWTIRTFVPNLLTPSEIDGLVRGGQDLTINWTGRHACERAQQAGYGVEFKAEFCEFTQPQMR